MMSGLSIGHLFSIEQLETDILENGNDKF
jgi:hypothetical protein